MLIYAGVCREHFEPATACRVAAALGVSPNAAVYDVSNAYLGVLNGIVEIANRIELGQCKAGLVVSCETAREINEVMIDRMVRQGTMQGQVSRLIARHRRRKVQIRIAHELYQRCDILSLRLPLTVEVIGDIGILQCRYGVAQ